VEPVAYGIDFFLSQRVQKLGFLKDLYQLDILPIKWMADGKKLAKFSLQ